MKNNYFYKKSLSNIYKKPSEGSEVISQILFGEKFKILLKKKNWIKIKVSYDKYIGYIKNKNYTSSYKPTHKVFIFKANVFKKPNIYSQPLVRLEKGKIVIIKKCRDEWCKITSGGYRGWIFKNSLWGKIK